MTRWMTMPAVFLLAACGSGGEEKAADMSPADTCTGKPNGATAANDGAISCASGRWPPTRPIAQTAGDRLTVLTIDAANLRFHNRTANWPGSRVRRGPPDADYRFSGERGMDRRMRLELAGRWQDAGPPRSRLVPMPPMRYSLRLTLLQETDDGYSSVLMAAVLRSPPVLPHAPAEPAPPRRRAQQCKIDAVQS